MRKTVLVLVETVDNYLPLLEQAGYCLIRARRNCAPMPFSNTPVKSMPYSLAVRWA